MDEPLPDSAVLVADGDDSLSPGRWIAAVGTIFLVLGTVGIMAFYLGPPSAGVLRATAMVSTFGFTGALYLGALAVLVGLLRRPREGWIAGIALVGVVVGWTALSARLPGRTVAHDDPPPVRVAPAPDEGP